MIELLQITNDPQLARLCDEIGGFRLFVDWERNGKAERQAGRNSFISSHTLDDLKRMVAAVQRTPVMVRLNPLYEGTESEIDQAVTEGASRLMLPLFRDAQTLAKFVRLVGGRLPISALMEHADALACLDEWVGLAGVDEVFVGLNDLHLSLKQDFMYQPLADGLVDRVLRAAQAAGKRTGFGGIARMDEGELSGRRVLGEHVRLGSQAVIVSRTFHRFDVGGDSMPAFRSEIERLRAAEQELALRQAHEIEADRTEMQHIVRRTAASVAARRAGLTGAG